MTQISLFAADQVLTATVKPIIASGDENSVLLHVDFDMEWDGYATSAVFFKENDRKVYEVILKNGECLVPYEVLEKSGAIFVGVRGVNAQDNTVKTTTLVRYKIAEGAPSGDGTTVPPTADVYKQLLYALDVANARIDTFTSLAKGSTTGDAELQDIRVAFDGKVYTNAGTAVRQQFKRMDTQIAQRVKTINGIGPDANGNVEIEVSDGNADQGSTGTGVSSGINAILNSWKGKKWYVLGDSISAEASIGTGHTDKLYHTFVKEYLGFGDVVNLAQSGSTVAKNSTSPKSMIDQLASVPGDADLITIYAGVNDRWFNTPIGKPDDTDTTTFYGAMNTLCVSLHENHSDTLVVFITPTEQNNVSCNSANTTGKTVRDLAKAMIEVCEKYSIDYYDANRRSGIYPQIPANSAMYTSDYLHLNHNGHKRLADNLVSFLLGRGNISHVVAAESIVLNPESMIFTAISGYKTLKVTLVPENANEAVKWYSTNTAVATINNYGAVFPKADGECDIVVTCGGVSAVCHVIVDVETDNGGETEVTLTSISATYSGGDVAVGTSVNDLTGITVKATYSDGSTANVTGYTLSGAIAEGNNTITVNYEGKTATFTVVGVAEEQEVTLSSISATFNQGSNVVYDTDSLDILKPYLTVTANYSDGSKATVSDYTLSGTLVVGTSKITVSYGGKTTTFNVTVSEVVEEFDVNNYVGKTWTVTAQRWANQLYIAVLIDGADIATGDTATVQVGLSNMENCGITSANTVRMYNTSQTKVDGYTAGVACFDGYDKTVEEVGGITVVSAEKTFYNRVEGTNVMLTFLVDTTALPASFKLESLTIKVNGEDATILDIGAYQSSDVVTIS